MNKKYCIMDMDGTLVDSMPYWSSLSPEYLRNRGIAGPFGDLMERIKPLTMPEACLVLKNEFRLRESAEEIGDQMKETMRMHYAKDVPLKEGVVDYLKALRGTGAKICIVTATALPLVRVCLKHLDIEKYFDFIMSCEEVGRGKTFPDAFLEAARRMGAQPEETVVFEDSFIALNTAKKAGFYTIAVYDECSDSWDRSREMADEVIDDWKAAAPM